MSDSDERERPLAILPTIDRRVTLKWLLAATGALALDTGSSTAGAAATVAGCGYGPDPDLTHPEVTWQRTMSARQRALAAAVADVIIPADEESPAASAVGVHEFLDEWVSAPYPDQQADRHTILPGLAWLDEQAHERFDSGFVELGAEQRAAICAALCAGSAVPTGAPAVFLDRLRYLVLGAYYTTRPGMAAIGYRGNQAIAGDYPGPTVEALAHVERELAKLGL